MSIRIENISKIYGKQKALNKISFEIKKGEIMGFLGPNGAGKSTLMKIITNFIPQNEGSIFVNGLDIMENSLEVRKKIGYLPENNPLYLEMYVKEYLNFIAGIYKIKNRNKKVSYIIEKTGLNLEKNKKIAYLSKGYKQRVGIAQVLIHDPEILILDEPTSGLDPNQIIEIRNLILEVSREKTILISTHIMQEVEALCNRVVIINKGNIIANDFVKEISSNIFNKTQNIIVEFDGKINIEKLKNINGILKIEGIKENKFLIISKNDIDIRPEIFNFCLDHNFKILSILKKEKNLEDIFHELTKD